MPCAAASPVIPSSFLALASSALLELEPASISSAERTRLSASPKDAGGTLSLGARGARRWGILGQAPLGQAPLGQAPLGQRN